MALTHGGFVGTPAFASPEQFTNAPVDVRSDIYSLGVTLWFLLTGHMLFSGRTIEEVQDARRSKPLPIEQLKAARVPRCFVSLLTSMLAIEPAARPAGARDLSRNCRQFALRLSAEANPRRGSRLPRQLLRWQQSLPSANSTHRNENDSLPYPREEHRRSSIGKPQSRSG